MRYAARIAGFVAVVLALPHLSQADDTNPDPISIAVAANFHGPLQQLAQHFTGDTGIPVEISSGSSGKLFAQIRNGAPYHIFLSADVSCAKRLEEEGDAVDGTRFTYATGVLALYSKAKSVSGMDLLASPDVKHIAIANPDLAPYGVAAMAAIGHAGLDSIATPKLVRGESVAQTFQFIESGAAECGFVSLSMVADRPKDHFWIVPAAYYDPIDQQGVLLTTGKDNNDAKAFLRFLQTPAARDIIKATGYAVPTTSGKHDSENDAP